MQKRINELFKGISIEKDKDINNRDVSVVDDVIIPMNITDVTITDVTITDVTIAIIHHKNINKQNNFFWKYEFFHKHNNYS